MNDSDDEFSDLRVDNHVSGADLSEEKIGSLVPIWKRIIEPAKIAAYLRICKSLGLGVEWPATMYATPVREPKIRMLTVVQDDPINIAHIKGAIAMHVVLHGIRLESHVAPNDLLPAQPKYKKRAEIDWDLVRLYSKLYGNGDDDDGKSASKGYDISAID